jgi:uncharacterized protein GlcG (DUF336 family)
MNHVSAPDGLVPTAGATRRHLLAGLGGAGLLAAGLAVTAVGPAAAQETTSLSTQDISLTQAQAVVAAAIAKATDMHVLMDIAVVDAGANLKAFARMDGAWLGSIDISIKKARTARFFNLPTGALGELSQPGGPLYQIEVSNGGLITFPGGVPLLASDGTIIGGIGVSGSSVEDDHAVASAGAAALGGPNLATPEATPGS